MALNVPVDEQAFWARLAAERGARSIGELQRRVMLLGLRLMNTAKADELIEIRKRYYGAALLTIFVAILAGSWLSHSEVDMRRCNRARRVRVEETFIFEES